MIDVALAIDAEAISVTRQRDAPGTYTTGGKYVDGSTTSTTIKATVQPASGRQLMDLPEGIRTEARFIAWSRSELKLGDRIVTTSVYKIIFVWPRPEGGFYRAALGQMA